MTVMLDSKFMNSKYFVPDPGNWHLKPGAPKEIVEDFNKWMVEYEKNKPKIQRSGNNVNR